MACLFCEIVNGERKAHEVYQDEMTYGFLDHRPLFPGHVLLVPREHYETVMDLPAPLVGPLFSSAQRLSRAVVKAMNAEGSLVAINNKVSQAVPHLHVHIVPRRRGDGLKGFFWPRHPYAGAGEMQDVRDAIRLAVTEIADRRETRPDAAQDKNTRGE
jgi:histidine triad (HIT) family protein